MVNARSHDLDIYGNTITLANPIGNNTTGSLTLNDWLGAGKLIVNAANAYSRRNNIGAGSTLQMGNANALGAATEH